MVEPFHNGHVIESTRLLLSIFLSDEIATITLRRLAESNPSVAPDAGRILISLDFKVRHCSDDYRRTSAVKVT